MEKMQEKLLGESIRAEEFKLGMEIYSQASEELKESILDKETRLDEEMKKTEDLKKQLDEEVTASKYFQRVVE